MDWIILVVVAVIAIALEVFCDNYICDVYFKGHDAPAQKQFFVLPQILFAIVILIIFGVDFSAVGPAVIAILVGSGIIVSVANVFFYKALEVDDSTNVIIFDQFTPVFYLVLGFLFLDEKISFLQMVAFAIIFSASFLVVATARKKSRKTKLRAVLYILIFILISVTGNLLFVKANLENLDYIVKIAFVFLGKGIGDFIILLFKPKWRQRYRYVVKKSGKKIFVPLFGSFLISIISESAYRGVLVSAPSVALASVVCDSALPIAIFFLGLLFTLMWPRFGREKLDKKSVIVHLLATILVVVGVFLIQSQ